MGEYTKYKVTIIQGTVGDMAIDQLGWLSASKQQEFWDDHNQHVKELKESGEYLKPLDFTVSVQHDPLYDKPSIQGKATESYRMVFLDLNKYN